VVDDGDRYQDQEDDRQQSREQQEVNVRAERMVVVYLL